jgi:UrcA family protein
LQCPNKIISQTATNAQLRGYLHHSTQEYIIMKPSIDLVCIVAIALTAVAMPILATASESVAVRYGATELASPATVAKLHSRIESAARQVCEQYAGRELARQRVFALCTGRSVAVAVKSVRSPALNAYHESHTGEPVATKELALKLAGQPLPMGVRIR